ncbi:MAG TPA: energy-coupling factor transporter transmembrane component T [Caproiciproducens sp.]|nr:energy-coupling factor transporter transmembrane component T [Caproiciproducens sp.]
MRSISLYQDKNTPIHKLDPLSKILYILVANFVPVLLGNQIATAVFILVSILILIIGKVLKRTAPMLGFSGLILITVVIIQGIFRQGNTTPVFALGSVVFYREGLLFALGITLNVINILMSFAILVLTTKPSDMVETFVRLGLSPKIGYVMSSVFQIIPQMTETMATITDAQRSRGMETEGRLLTRIKAFFPLISPVVMNSLITTRERAVALEVRGFDSRQKKTFLTDLKKSRADQIFKAVLAAVFILSIVGRVLMWLI